MNCDLVFAILTRGPFPTGHPSDRQVEAHLSTCPGCYRLAEALRPAFEMDEEAIPADESRYLPGYWGELRPAPSASRGRPTQVAVRRPAARPVMQAPPKRWTRILHQPASRLAAAVLVGVLLALVLRSAGVSEKPVLTDAAAPSSSERTWSKRLPITPPAPPAQQPPRSAEQVAALRALALVPACFGSRLDLTRTTFPAESPQSEDYHALQCCTQCHNQSRPGTAPAALSTLTRSCTACHERSQRQPE